MRRAWISRRASGWPVHSRLFLLDPSPGWALAEEARQLRRLAQLLAVQLGPPHWAGYVRKQSLFCLSQFSFPNALDGLPNRVATTYYHGRPGTAGHPEFAELYEQLCRRHASLTRVQVTNDAMRDLVLESGIDGEKVHLIRIGVDPAVFVPPTAEERRSARKRLGVPEQAFAVGSLVKDGVGFGEGLVPKPVKGPDVLLATLERAAEQLPDLFVVLTGPARGYVKAGLERLAIRFLHVVLPHADLPRVYWALDACLVGSREEGGPKSVLEAMASGVPVVTTRVGQAAELVRSSENGFTAPVEDAEALAAALEQVHDGAATPELLAAARRTAEENAYEAQLPHWREFFRGFVSFAQ